MDGTFNQIFKAWARRSIEKSVLPEKFVVSSSNFILFFNILIFFLRKSFECLSRANERRCRTWCVLMSWKTNFLFRSERQKLMSSWEFVETFRQSGNNNKLRGWNSGSDTTKTWKQLSNRQCCEVYEGLSKLIVIKTLDSISVDKYLRSLLKFVEIFNHACVTLF